MLANRRRELGLSQSVVASGVSLNVSTWSRIENGASALTVEQLAAAAEVLGIAPSVLLRAVDEKVAEFNKRGHWTCAKHADAVSIMPMLCRLSSLGHYP
jgi:transcriptional regulator with XRE-family HTH domain